MQEIYRKLVDYLSAEKRIEPEVVARHYHQLSPDGDKKISELVQQVTVWQDSLFTDILVNSAQVYYSNDIPKGHPDHLLTSDGTIQGLPEVAQRYLELQRQGTLPDHQYIRNIEYFMKELKAGNDLPHIIAIRGRLRQKTYIIDGNTRSIAMAVVAAEEPKQFPCQRVYIGRPALFSPLFDWAI